MFRTPSTVAALSALLFACVIPPASAGDKFPFTLTEMKGRPGKLLHKAAYGKDGQLGFLHDVDGDGKLEFVYLSKEGDSIGFEILSLETDEPILQVDLGEGFPAGLAAASLDEDAASEYIAVYGSRKGELAKLVVKSIFSAIVSFGVALQTNWVVVRSPAAAGVDVFDLVAIDDDGSILWRRNLRDEIAAGESWDNTRFQSIVAVARGSSATVLLTDDGRGALLGLSGKDGSTVWSRDLAGGTRPSKRFIGELVDDGQALPVLFDPGTMLILNPENGEAVLDGEVDKGVGMLPTWHTFGEGETEGFLVFGDDRNELRMLSLKTGEARWSHEVEKVKAVLPLSEDSFMVVWRFGIKIFNTDGELLKDIPAPDKIKTVFSPVLRDMDGDGSTEFVFTSGKKIMCWNPQADKVLWTTSLATFVGGANPVALFDRFFDIDGDGWLDVPAAAGSGTGHWLSGKTGEILIKGAVGAGNPLVGDWNEDGTYELFWYKAWWEIKPR